MPRFGTMTTFAGTGQPGFESGHPAPQCALREPFYLVFDRSGGLYIAESGNCAVRWIAPASAGSRLETVAGTGQKGFGGDGGPALDATFNDVVSVAWEPKSGDLFIVDRLNARIRRVDGRTKTVSTVVGTGVKGDSGDKGPGEKAQLREPHDCVLDGRGGLLIDDVADHRIRRYDLQTGIVTTFGGTGQRTHTGDDGPVERASFAGPRALAFDPNAGLLYVCEREGNTVRRVDLRTGIITLYAGTGHKGYTGDGGAARSATFNGPKGLCVDARGNLYVVDTENHAIRCVEAASGIISTVAGGRKGATGDGGPASEAGLNRPHGATIGPDGALYIADSENHRVRRAPLATG